MTTDEFFSLPLEWKAFLNGQYDFSNAKAESLIDFVSNERNSKMVHPDQEEMFAAFHLTLPDQCQVVLLGQDPYPTAGNAHGLSFSVKDSINLQPAIEQQSSSQLPSSQQPGLQYPIPQKPAKKLPGSLKNIFKERHADLGIPPSQSGDLTAWARQGVLLLNTVLTVESGEPGSHRKKGWEVFTDAVIKSISAQERKIIFWLWGNDAQKKRDLIDVSRHIILETVHPSPLSASRGFFGSKPFSRTNAILKDWGRAEIDWRNE